MKPITGTEPNGVKKVLRIRLFSGRFIDCTENHPLLTVGGWREAATLAVDESIAVARRLPFPAAPKPLPRHFGRLLGYIVGDGSFGKGQPIITTAEPETVRRFEEIASEHGWRLYKDGKYGYHFRSARLSRGWRQDTATVRLREFIKPARSAEKVVPPCMFEAPEQDVRDFLSAYFAADGTSNDRREGTATYTSISEQLLRGVQHLLTRLGIWSNLRRHCSKIKGQDYFYWQLRINGGDLVKFAEVVDVEGKKGQMLQATANKARQKRHFPEQDSIPAGWRSYLPRGCGRRDAGLTLGTLRRKYGIRADKNYKRGTARHIVEQVAELTGNEDIRKLCSPDIAWDRVVEIEDLGEKETFAISVRDDKTYISGEVISHNSETCTVRAPAYLLEQNPEERILVTGYNETMARRFSRKTRTIIRTRIPLSKEKSGVDEWETLEGGGLVARGVGTPPTGFGFGWIFIDDPIKKREEAESETYRNKTWDWYTDDLYTRLEPGGKIVMTLTRWHHDDIAARAIASEPEKWRILKLPALAEENDPIGRQVGEPLWPERFSREALLRIQDIQTDEMSGAHSFEALYQQNPTPREGAFFKVSQLRIEDAPPAKLNIVRAWDLAASTKGDYTAGVKLGKDAETGLFWILDVQRGQWTPDDRNRVMLQTAALDGKTTKIRIAQDPGQAGVDQVQALTRMLAGYSVRSERVSGSKEARADALAAQINAGNVRMIKGEWNKAFIEEMRTFPLGRNDDQVDAAADSFSELTSGGEFNQWQWIR